ncbi:MAG TPA: Fis family transcriptional regulator [Desulfobacteraceae bacterium]|nr:Fis family transcriptional regulator [Desulfobacteraceae bacterium]
MDADIQVLVVDDDEDFCYGIRRIVSRLGHGCRSVATMAGARAAAASQRFDLVLLDVGLPDGSGLDLLPELKALEPAPEVVIITGAGDAGGAELAILNGAWDYIEKSASTKEISLTVSRVLQYHTARRKAADPDRVTSLVREKIIGSSPAIQKALDKVARAAASDANVLITGETGTGKELFARAVHENSVRSGGEMVVVDCASMPENLAENILFGHKKGVYTGADAERPGLVACADKGTLFLDEIGELTQALQKKLLRVLQEKRFRPLGGGREVASDFRLVAATNRDLSRMADEGSFRKDLLFRIRSFHIELPALRHRGRDVAALARHYLDACCIRQGLDSKGVSSDFFEVLAAYSWPGNVRELAHTMEHAVLAAMNDPKVFPAHLPKSLRVSVVTSGFSGGQTHTAEGKDDDFEGYEAGATPTLAAYRETVLSNYEKKYLSDLMARTPSVAKACQVSGLSRSRLYALLKKYGLSGR